MTKSFLKEYEALLGRKPGRVASLSLSSTPLATGPLGAPLPDGRVEIRGVWIDEAHRIPVRAVLAADYASEVVEVAKGEDEPPAGLRVALEEVLRDRAERAYREAFSALAATSTIPEPEPLSMEKLREALAEAGFEL